jgi:hypothetical protein
MTKFGIREKPDNKFELCFIPFRFRLPRIILKGTVTSINYCSCAYCLAAAAAAACVVPLV